jgi:hypothetical protein
VKYEIRNIKLNFIFKLQMNYFYLKHQLHKTPIVPMQAESFENILDMIPEKYQKSPKMRKMIENVFEETEKVYHEAMKKSVVQSVLLAPKVKGLENEKAGPIPKDPEYVGIK